MPQRAAKQISKPHTQDIAYFENSGGSSAETVVALGRGATFLAVVLMPLARVRMGRAWRFRVDEINKWLERVGRG